MYAIGSLFKWIISGNRVLFQAFLIYFCFKLRLEMQCISSSSYVCLISLAAFASILRHTMHFPPNVSQVLMIILRSVMTIFGIGEGTSENSINRLSKRMPMLESNEVKMWLPVKLLRDEILPENMMKSRSFCLSLGCSSANQILSGARLLARALPGNFREKHEKQHIKIFFQNDVLWEKKFSKILLMFK